MRVKSVHEPLNTIHLLRLYIFDNIGVRVDHDREVSPRKTAREPRSCEAGEEWLFLMGWVEAGSHAALLAGSYSHSTVR